MMCKGTLSLWQSSVVGVSARSHARRIAIFAIFVLNCNEYDDSYDARALISTNLYWINLNCRSLAFDSVDESNFEIIPPHI